MPWLSSSGGENRETLDDGPIPGGSAPADELRSRLGGTAHRPLSEVVDLIQADQARCWRGGDRVPAEVYLGLRQDVARSPEEATDIIYGEYLLRRERGESPRLEEYLDRFPGFADRLRSLFELEQALDPLAATQAATPGDHPGLDPVADRPVIDDFEILDELGRGGMAVVYLARDLRLDRLVALKLIGHSPPIRGDEVDRFNNEARAVARLRHPNIVQIYAVGEQAGSSYLAMEYLEGGNLRSPDGTPRPPREAARLVEAIARGVAEAHRQGVVHRDLKPANILLTADGTPKVADFGLAKLIEGDSQVTRSGVLIGSPSYMAPEQADGSAGSIGPAADIHALGAILYELLVGRPPYRGVTVGQTLELVRSADPVPPSRQVPGLPRDLETIGLKCLEKDPGRRYGSAIELADDLRRFLDDEPIRARFVSAPERAWRWARRRPLMAGLSAAVPLLLVTLAIGSTVAAVRIGAVAAREAVVREELRRTLYITRMNLAATAWESANIRRLRELLEPYRDGSPDAELRGFEWGYWWRQAHPDRLLLDLEGHRQAVAQLAFSPDGSTLATTALDRTLRLWDATTGTPRCALPIREKSDFLPLAFSGDGSQVAAPGRGRHLTVWDARSGAVRAELGDGRDRGRVRRLAFEPGGSRLIAVYDTGRVVLWDLARSTPVRELPALPGGVTCAAISADRRAIAMGLPDGSILLRDPADGSVIGRLDGQPPYVRSLAFSPDGRRLASGGQDKMIRLWDLARRAPLGAPLEGHAMPPWELAFAPDGRTLASASLDNTVKLWDVATGRCRGTLKGHSGVVNCLDYSPDGRRLATGSLDRTAKVWDLSDRGPREALPAHRGGVDSLLFTSDGSALITAGRDQSFKLWDVATGTLRRTVTVASRPRALALSPSRGTPLATASLDSVRLWDSETWAPIPRPEPADGPRYPWAIAFSPEGRTLAVSYESGHLELRRADSGGLIRTLARLDFPVHSLAYTPDGNALVVGTADGYEVRDLASGRRRFRLPGPDKPSSLGGLPFSPDGTALAVGFADGTAIVWDVATWRPRLILTGHGGEVTGAAFSPDGRRLATSSRDRSVRLWDLATGEIVTTLHGHDENVMAVAFSRDGRTLASASLDGTVRLWRSPPPH